jgi:hypothetical protein
MLYPVWIDDLNNVLHVSSEEEIQKLRDTIKDLMSNPEWPVQVIVSGVPDLFPFFRKDRQLRRRFRYLYLTKLTPNEANVHLAPEVAGRGYLFGGARLFSRYKSYARDRATRRRTPIPVRPIHRGQRSYKGLLIGQKKPLESIRFLRFV